MDINTLIQTVDNSTVADWSKINDMHPIHRWVSGHNQNGNYTEPITFEFVAVYSSDIDISLAVAATVNAQFNEPWIQGFSAPGASSVAVWLRYRGVPVQQWDYVLVDGLRYLIPMPEPTSNGYQISQSLMPRARLLFDLYGPGGQHQSADSALRQTGVAIV